MKRCLPLLLSLCALAIPASASATTFGAQVGGIFTGQLTGQLSQPKVASSLSALYKAGGRVGRADSNWAVTEPKAPVHGRHTYKWGLDDMIVTEMAVIDVTPDGLVLREIAADTTLDEVRAATDAPLIVAEGLGTFD